MFNDNNKIRNDHFGQRGLKIKRVFTKDKLDRYQGITFEKRSSKLVNPDGSVITEIEGIEVPSFWSQIATDILAQKYLRKRGVPQKDQNGNYILDQEGKIVLGGEKSAREAVDRLAHTWRWWGEKYGYFDSVDDANAFEDEIAYMLIHQIASPNSPQWFNTGLALIYNITGNPQGHWFVDPDTKELKQSEDAYTRAQAHACFILSIKDDLVNEGGIFQTLVNEARIFKYGSGSGINFSPIRSVGEPLSGGGSSSGLMSFLKIFDSSAGSIKSGGTTRRAAKMVCLNMDHPEIEDFIEWKVKEERKVLSLVAGSHIAYNFLTKIMRSAYENGLDPRKNTELKRLIKEARANNIPENYIKRVIMLVENGVKPDEFTFERYNTDFRSEAYGTVSGQNSNNSVRVTNEFFYKLLNDEYWDLKNRTDGSVSKTVKARSLWGKVVQAAWECADPGVQYDTTINEWHTCPNDGRINASNPCSEYMFLDDTACNLASLNLLSFYDSETNRFDVEKYKHAIRLWTIVLEITVLMSHLPSKEVALNTYLYRTLGLGYGNLGALLMQMGIPYESEEGYAMTAVITAILGGESYATSAEMAKYLGPFERFHANKENMLRVIRNHRRAIYGAPDDEYEGLSIRPMRINYELAPNYILDEARNSWDEALELGTLYGYRNAQTTLIAPTGTIGLQMDFDTTGIEPDYALVKFKKLVGGGYLKIVNQSVRPSLKRLGYNDRQIDDIEKYILGHLSFDGCPYINTETLLGKGFDLDKIREIEQKLRYADSLDNLFSVQSIGFEYLQRLSISRELLDDKNFDLLKYLGFTDQEVEEAEKYIFGSATIEGAPHIKEEHLKVFDCANKCGKYGKRFVSPVGHIKQMAAAQSFLSGAISKTVNLPEDATIRDVEEIYMMGWKLMLKAVALYRDNSKLSQPLTTGSQDRFSALFEDKIPHDVGEETQKDSVQVSLETSSDKNRPVRKKLPPERYSITHKFNVAGHKGYLTVGLFEDGSPGEIFINMSTAGSFLAGIMDALAISLSLNLQYGVPLETLIRNLSNLRFEPSGVTSNPEIPIVKSITDYIAKWLALKFLPPELAKLYHNHELVDKSYSEGGSNHKLKLPTNDNAPAVSNQTVELLKPNLEQELDDSQQMGIDSTVDTIRRAVSLGFTGEVCKNCGSLRMKKSGSCSVCIECGMTTGCS